MNLQRDVDSIIATWLDDGPVDLPMDTRRAISVGVRTQPRARRMAFPGGFSMRSFNLVAAATVIVLAVGGSVFVLSNRSNGPGVGGPPTPTASPNSTPELPSPTPGLLDTSSWVAYPSDRYGFTIARPEDWVENPAERNWTFPDDARTWEHLEAVETFNNPAGSIGFSAWSWPVAQGTTLEAWMETYCEATGGQACSTVADRAVPQVTGDGHSGLGLFGPDTDTIAFFLDGDVAYVTAIWRGETDPAVAPYGGARRLLEAFLSTMRLETRPASAPPSSAAP
jgi:hypothetical protein